VECPPHRAGCHPSNGITDNGDRKEDVGWSDVSENITHGQTWQIAGKKQNKSE